MQFRADAQQIRIDGTLHSRKTTARCPCHWTIDNSVALQL